MSIRRSELLRDDYLQELLKDEVCGDEEARNRYINLTYKRGQDEPRAPSNSTQATFELKHPGAGYLFDYQRELARKIVRLYDAGGSKAFMSLPTGGGKTRTALWAVLDILGREQSATAVWIAPGRELLDQAVDALKDVWRVNPAAEEIGVVRAYVEKRFSISNEVRVIFVTPQLLHAIYSSGESFPEADLVVFDEAHHAIARTYRAGVERLVGESQGCLLIGLSATPGRQDKEETEDLVRFFDRNIIVSRRLGEAPVESLRDRKVLAHLQFKQIDPGNVLPGMVVTRSGQRGPTLEELAKEPSRFRAVIRKGIELSKDERSLVFAASIRHANALAAVWSARGVSVGVVTSNTPSPERAQLVQAFKEGKLEILVNKKVLATGYDCPAVQNAILTVPVGSAITFEQIVGRVSRGPAVGGHEQGRVWQIDDHVAMHGEPSSYARYSGFDWKGLRKV